MHDLVRLLTPSRFLTAAGCLLILMGSAGLTGVLGRLSSASVFHPPYWIHAVHLAFGSVLLVIAFAGAPGLQTAFVLIGTAMGLTLGMSGLLFGSLAARRFKKPELAELSDHLTHLTVGLLAFWAWHNRAVGRAG